MDSKKKGKTVADFEEVIPGLQARENENGFTAVKMHYTADPEKATDEWYEETRRGYTEPAWQREYEMDFGAMGGELAFRRYFVEHGDKIIIPDFEVPGSWPKYGTMDYGTVAPTAFLVYTIDNNGSIIVIWEYYSPGPLSKHADAILNCPYFYDLGWITIDPAMTSKTQNVDGNLHSIQDLLADSYEIFTIPGNNDRRAGWERIKWHWRDLDNREPTLKITRSCKNLIRELNGLRYDEWSATMAQKRNPKEDIIPKDDHTPDSLRYGIMSQPKIPEQGALAGRGVVSRRQTRRMRRKNTIARDNFRTKKGHPVLGKFYD